MTAAEPTLPDEMGVWTEGGETVWLPKAHYPGRSQAIRWAVKERGVAWTDVRCLSRWMRHERREERNADGSLAYAEDEWWECDEGAPGAFPVWRLGE